MQPRITNLPSVVLKGHRCRMSLANDQTRQLFQGFMPMRNSIVGRTDNKVYDLRVYEPELDFSDFGPTTTFTKWAAVAVDTAAVDQPEFHTFHLPGGLYACFEHRGPAADAIRVFGYIFQQWLPTSGYQIDDRPHFEIMEEGYQPMSPDAEEQIWIPLKIN